MHDIASGKFPVNHIDEHECVLFDLMLILSDEWERKRQDKDAFGLYV